MNKKLVALLLAAVMLLTLTAAASAEGMKPGTYTKTVKGMYDGLTVEVTVTEDKIESVKVLDHVETAPGWPALEKIPAAIVANQTVGVDAVAGATRTSEGIINGVRLALEEAGADLDIFSKPAEKAAEIAVDYFPVMGSFEVPAQWDETFDVVVVGGGFAGMAAAYAAVEQGASTVLVEKLSTTGGNSAINGGQYASYTSSRAKELQEKFNLEPDTAEKHIEDTLQGGDNMSNLPLVENMVHASPVYFNLLLDNGLKIRDVLARPGGHYGYRTYVTENQVGSDITNLQLEMLKNTMADIRLETKMVEIYRTRDDANHVVGIRVATADGYRTIQATKGVILATGGFGANVQMRQTQVPYLTEEIPTTNIKAASTGEGIYLAQAIGANTTQMSNIQRYPFANPEDGVLDGFAVWPFTGPSFGIVYVDYQGNRYVNEGERRDVCANAASNSGFISTYSIFTKEVIPFAKDEELALGLSTGRVMMGDTLEELAQKMNEYAIKGQYPQVSADNLKATIERHNGFIDSGKDEEFGKVMAGTMVKMTEGPYYALAQFPSVHHTMGGLVIDQTTKVYDIYGQVIPGLYAAGEVTGGVHGTNRLGSNADADACGIGYISGIYVSTGEMPDFIPAK
ncbi:MAG: flavocytochrome c [Clostridiales bacterium]|nr:flavocytochrome c [Clostridiales bacterium]